MIIFERLNGQLKKCCVISLAEYIICDLIGPRTPDPQPSPPPIFNIFDVLGLYFWGFPDDSSIYISIRFMRSANYMQHIQ